MPWIAYIFALPIDCYKYHRTMPFMMNAVKTIAPSSRFSVVFAIHLMIASLACLKGSVYFFKEDTSDQTPSKPIKLILIGQTGAGE